MNHKRRNGHVWAGTLLLVVGSLLFTRALGVPYPSWLFIWPVLLIAIGLFIGLRHGFRAGGWVIPIIIGGIFLAEKTIAGASFRPFIAPAIIISLGFLFIFRARDRSAETHGVRREMDGETYPSTRSDEGENGNFNDRRDFIDTTSVFGGVKKIVLSKNFKGGDPVNFMGGSEINLTQADFTGRVHIETTTAFGGTKLIVPSTWHVQSEVVAIFGGVDDKRHFNGVSIDPNKVLIIEGTCLFGGIEIRSF